jgi:hypothetical protein
VGALNTNVASGGVVRVMAECCSTCIFRPGNLMHLQPGRIRAMVAEVRRTEGCIPCHKTLDLREQAVCRGQFDAAKTQPLQVAERLGLIQYVQPLAGGSR